MKIDLEGIHIHSDTNFGETDNGKVAFELIDYTDSDDIDHHALSLSFKNDKGEEVTAVLPSKELKAFSAILQNYVNEVGEG